MQCQIVSRGSVCPGSSDPGNKMDATNLATIFAPNLLHTLPEDVAEMAAAAAATSPTSPHGGGGAKGGAAFLSSNTSSFSAMATGSPERMDSSPGADTSLCGHAQHDPSRRGNM